MKHLGTVLTTGEIAKSCEVNPRTVKRWIEQGGLKAYSLPVTGFLRVRVEDFLEFLEHNRMPVPAQFAVSQAGAVLETRPAKILVVDDEPVVVDAIRHALISAGKAESGYAVEGAGDGFEAGQKIALFKPDLVILDMRMPGLRGSDVCRNLKRDSARAAIRVLMMSAGPLEECRKEAADAGADDFLPKPFDHERLLQHVARLLKKGAAS